MRVFGLIGFPLSHSFSADYFNTKFRILCLKDHNYKLFPIKNLSEFPKLLLSEPNLAGLNVTIPYKEGILSLLDAISAEAKEIGAVNCIRISEGKLTGFNTDCIGFEKAYIESIKSASSSAIILGNGGASKAVQFVFQKHGINFIVVTRNKSEQSITYQNVTAEIIYDHKIIINTTPLGMFPSIMELPGIPYQYLNSDHLLIDLVYNPEITAFLQKGKDKGCSTFNGLQMLHFQAEKTWEIWNSTS